MTVTGFDNLADVLGRLDGVIDKGGEQYEARCPAHEDRRQSLSVARGDNGGVVLCCHVGCSVSDVLGEIGLELRDIMPPNGSTYTEHPKPATNGKSKAKAHTKTFPTASAAVRDLEQQHGPRHGLWTYHNADGEPVGVIVRWNLEDGKKEIRPASRNGVGWFKGGMPSPRPLYHAPDLVDADRVLVFEGEPCVDAAREIGFSATTSPHGSQSAGKADWTPLAGKEVVIFPDFDAAGRKYADDVRVILEKMSPAATVRTIELPAVNEGDDIVDWLKRGGDAEQLAKLIDDAFAEPVESETPAICKPDQRLTDLGNAKRLVARHGADLRYCHPWSTWLIYDGARWSEDKTGEVERRAKDATQELWMEAANRLLDSEDRKRLLQFAATSEKAERLRAMASLARSEPTIPILPEHLDRDPWLLCCPNGVVDLRTGELREHRRDDYITKLCHTNYNPDASSYHFDRFIEGVFGGKQSLIDFARRLFGYALCGEVREQIMAIAHGSGSNGKSTLLESLMQTFGDGYAMQAVSDLLMVKQSESHPTERADLRGMRLVCCIETGDGKSLNEALVKQLTGSDRIRARKLYQDFFEFPPTHTVVLCTNHRPTIKGSDHAIWRRLILLPFDVRFWDPDKGETGPPELKMDKKLPMKLRDEAEGILAWCVRGCLEWQRDGLQVPSEVREATGQYRADQDRVGQFITECCVTNSLVRERANLIYAAYRSWTERRGEYPVSQTRFGEAITERGIEKRASNGIWYIGITLRDNTNQEME